MRACFQDRRDAGRRLAALLREYAGRPDVIVLALPRGGVPVGFEIARSLGVLLDVFLVRKLGLPGHEELAMGALASGGVRVLDQDLIRIAHVSESDVERVTSSEQAELERRERRYRGDRPFPDVTGRTVILVDDGLATGSTMHAGVLALRKESPARIIVAVPVAARETCNAFRNIADDIVCAETPEPFIAVGLWYEDFSQTTDEEVHELLEKARLEPADARAELQPLCAPQQGIMPEYDDDKLERTISIPADAVALEGTLGVPVRATGIVLFAHGTGSSRFSPRNRYVARVFRDAGLGTLLLDLLSKSEEDLDEITRHYRFDIAMLADRLVAAIDWLHNEPETAELPVGLFGASTGGGAALVAAAARPDRVNAVVSRGGRPDLAGDALPHVEAPTMLIVGGRDEVVISLNEQARDAMRSEVQLEVVAGATHLFQERGTLEQVASLARDWFLSHLHHPVRPTM